MKPILFVDLDESLIRTDILREQLMRAFAISPWKTFKLLFRLRFRPEAVKAAIVLMVETDPSTLPYNQDVLSLIHQARKEKRQVVLATATHEKVAKQIAQHLDLFDDVLATTDTHNCKGQKKLRMMKEYAKKHPFHYVGDSRADVAIFKEAKTPYIVGNLSYDQPHERIKTPSILQPFLKVIRPHQWAKNSLIFLPLLTSHIINSQTILNSFLGFFCFSFAASAIYIINDMVDVEDDRHHPDKKKRPFAKGDLTIDQGLWLSFSLLLITIIFSLIWLPTGLWVLMSYIVLTFLYSFSLKSQPVLDVFCLSALYTIRVLYGQFINAIEQSSWLLAFCVFFFLSLAFMKRTAEINLTQRHGHPLAKRRGYQLEDDTLLKISGIASGLLSVLVLALYINSEQITTLYLHPEFLWGVVYVLLYWTLRFWLIATRGEMDQDPVIFALKDKASFVIGGIVIFFGVVAKGLL